MTEYNQGQSHYKNLGNKRQRHFLDLSDNLKYTNQHANQHTEAKHWCSDPERSPKHFVDKGESEISIQAGSNGQTTMTAAEFKKVRLLFFAVRTKQNRLFVDNWGRNLKR